MSVRKRGESGPGEHNHNSSSRQTLINVDRSEDELQSDLRGDRGNIAILFFLYLLQGIPIGLTAAIPMLLQNRGANYKQQAEFSFAHWPFSLKLLWAPIVDSLFWSRFGRRKSWLIPTQYLIGLFMLLLSGHVNRWLGGDGTAPNIQVLTTIFFALNFLAATQDIAVDGWALTMLRRRNVGHASTCNSVGQTAGYFLGYVAFIALESTEFCNTYLRQVPASEGMVTLPGFLWFWGIMFVTSTTLVAIFKRENNPADNERTDRVEQQELNISETYALLFKIIKMRPIQIIAAVLLTVKVGFAACDAVSSLKLIDAGVPKDKLALLIVPLVPLQIVLPLIISKYTTGPMPMDVYLKAIPYRLFFGVIASVIVAITPAIITPGQPIPIYYYVMLLINYGFYQITLYSMFVAVMAFFARVSDPAVGGTYMTLLNTVSNLGGNWPTTVVLWLVDVLTWRECNGAKSDGVDFSQNTCANKIEQDECAAGGGKCNILIDGYYMECAICLVYGIVWYRWGKRCLNALQRLPMNVWHVVERTNTHNGPSRR